MVAAIKFIYTDQYLQLPMQISVYHHWSCEFESHSGEVYSIQHYVIKFVSDLRRVGGFLWILQFPQPKKLTATI